MRKEEGLSSVDKDNMCTNLEEIISKYDKKIYSFVYNIVRNREEAMDITQDSFVKAIKYIHSYNSGKNFATWMCTIEKNTNYDYLKKKSHNIAASSIENEESM
ncbi:sigma-70 family RNA polymerase sigma factor [Clostridium sp. FP2]|uniref:sigma-70 family RNA polymerase sigma factor n=1 Tax=Clostridium TaxID=1485 RepID=UPI0013E99D89|nr:MULTISPECIES: sigma-70 family RNA polymerase sigma factor [Clostridium]MBW9158815.1 sigma-70 family RNA polymerase sigma factor [Clostridium tagluense]MBZ9623277.1 sigma-70 family RNA polymerase sigma factor [Clostridium sp. FP2]WLC67429.1 sigma-70 family RNA polymerase sigma factor [Clostridium tagluense]